MLIIFSWVLLNNIKERLEKKEIFVIRHIKKDYFITHTKQLHLASLKTLKKLTLNQFLCYILNDTR